MAGLRVHLWGTRGSIPVAQTGPEIEARLRHALAAYRAAGCPADLEGFLRDLPFATRRTYGGDTCCVEVSAGGPEILALDGGSGLRRLGDALMRQRTGPQTVHLFFSHFHWDHIQGLPFFRPAYLPGNVVHFHAVQPDLRTILYRQQHPDNFPVDLDYMQATFRFHRVNCGRAVRAAGCTLRAFPHHHPGGAYGYVVEGAGRKVVYSTDCEYTDMTPAEISRVVTTFRGADLLIFDAQYTPEEAVSSRYQWGHSTFAMGVDLARLAGVRRLCFFHHDPASSDEHLAEMFAAAQKYVSLQSGPTPCELFWAHDGMEFTL